MDREESTKTNATTLQGARFRTLLSIHSPAEGRRPAATLYLCSLWPLCEDSVGSVPHRELLDVAEPPVAPAGFHRCDPTAERIEGDDHDGPERVDTRQSDAVPLRKE